MKEIKRKKYVDPFLYNVPRTDIHGYDRTGAVAKVIEFINDYAKIDEKKIIVVHGKGTGILKNEVHNYLKHDKRVLKYYINVENDGETIIELL